MASNENARDGLALARQAYMFGVGNGGKPLRDRQALLDMSTVSKWTLAKHTETWDKELEEIARSAAFSPTNFVLREDVLRAHAEDVEWLRRQTDSLKHEVDTLENTQKSLWELLTGIEENLMLTSNDFEEVSRLLEGYLNQSVNRQKLLALFLTTQKRWQDSSAVSSTIAAYETSLKETAKLKAKAEGLAASQPENVTPGSGLARANTTVFRQS